MVYKIIFAESAKDDIDKLDTVIQKRLSKKLILVAGVTDVMPISKRLTGNLEGMCRIRIGDYRILFVLQDKNINILRVQHRKDVYR
jgi:mRNA interferase RelE/StbE